MNRHTFLWFLFGLIVKINTQHETDWKPILGPRLPIKLLPQQSISSRVLNMASSSRSSITFNGQTITTNIGDIGTNDAAGSVLTVDAPDLISDIDNEPHYVGYSGGKILNGFLTAAVPVSFYVELRTYFFSWINISYIESDVKSKLLFYWLTCQYKLHFNDWVANEFFNRNKFNCMQ